MATAFPGNINNLITRGSFTEQPITDVIQTQMEVGGVKTRPRSTRVRYQLSGTINMTTTEYENFKTFWAVSLVAGSLPVEYQHALASSPSDYLMTWQSRDAGANNYSVTIQFLEI